LTIYIDTIFTEIFIGTFEFRLISLKPNYIFLKQVGYTCVHVPNEINNSRYWKSKFEN